MPQATDELRNRMNELFGDPVDDSGPIKFLQDAGYKLTRKWTWIPAPGVTGYGEMSKDELDCLDFLCDEWDFGGLEI